MASGVDSVSEWVYVYEIFSRTFAAGCMHGTMRAKWDGKMACYSNLHIHIASFHKGSI